MKYKEIGFFLFRKGSDFEFFLNLENLEIVGRWEKIKSNDE